MLMVNNDIIRKLIRRVEALEAQVAELSTPLSGKIDESYPDTDTDVDTDTEE